MIKYINVQKPYKQRKKEKGYNGILELPVIIHPAQAQGKLGPIGWVGTGQSAGEARQGWKIHQSCAVWANPTSFIVVLQLCGTDVEGQAPAHQPHTVGTQETIRASSAAGGPEGQMQPGKGGKWPGEAGVQGKGLQCRTCGPKLPRGEFLLSGAGFSYPSYSGDLGLKLNPPFHEAEQVRGTHEPGV